MIEGWFPRISHYLDLNMNRSTILKISIAILMSALVVLVSIDLGVFWGYVLPLTPVVILTMLQKRYGWNELLIYGISAVYYLLYILL